MRGRISGKGKIKMNRGSGSGVLYNPWIHTREVSSSGTKSLLVDWKHGRQIHTLSRNETYFYYILRWDDNVLDINEQYPLDRNKTERIAEALSVKHPVLFNDKYERMTTDFLVTKKNGDDTFKIAYSVKDKYEQLFGDINNKKVKRLVEKQSIEMSYWKLQGVDFKVVFGDKDINKILARNIELIVNHYNIQHVQTIYEFMCYLLSHKYISIPMENTPLNIVDITHDYLYNSTELNYWLSVIESNGEILLGESNEIKAKLLNNMIEE